ncbi:MAG: response regulator [Ginsengibacter sp.]
MENNGLIKYQGDLIKHVGNAISVTNKLISLDLRILKIMHLDDHKIFLDGILNCISKRFPNSVIELFQNSKKALDYVSNCLENNEKLDLIITGINLRQPELDGIDFTKAVRKKELEYDRKIPILGLDLYDDEIFIQKFLNAGIDRYLTSDTSCEEINYTINTML